LLAEAIADGDKHHLPHALGKAASPSQQAIRRQAPILVRPRPPFWGPYPPVLVRIQPRTPELHRVDLERLSRLGGRVGEG
jgi:hypothetical protein